VEQSKENEFLLKMIGIPCRERERESEYSCRNSIKALNLYYTNNYLLDFAFRIEIYLISLNLSVAEPPVLLTGKRLWTLLPQRAEL
jgi:hypothetical protein